jgi:hypothetical protein
MQKREYTPSIQTITSSEGYLKKIIPWAIPAIASLTAVGYFNIKNIDQSNIALFKRDASTVFDINLTPRNPNPTKEQLENEEKTTQWLLKNCRKSDSGKLEVTCGDKNQLTLELIKQGLVISTPNTTATIEILGDFKEEYSCHAMLLSKKDEKLKVEGFGKDCTIATQNLQDNLKKL